MKVIEFLKLIDSAGYDESTELDVIIITNKGVFRRLQIEEIVNETHYGGDNTLTIEIDNDCLHETDNMMYNSIMQGLNEALEDAKGIKLLKRNIREVGSDK